MKHDEYMRRVRTVVGDPTGMSTKELLARLWDEARVFSDGAPTKGSSKVSRPWRRSFPSRQELIYTLASNGYVMEDGTWGHGRAAHSEHM